MNKKAIWWIVGIVVLIIILILAFGGKKNTTDQNGSQNPGENLYTTQADYNSLNNSTSDFSALDEAANQLG